MFLLHPGVTAPGNRRPRKPGKMKSSQVKSGRKTAEVKATIPVKSPVKVMNLSADTTTITQDVGSSVHDNLFHWLDSSKDTSMQMQLKFSI